MTQRESDIQRECLDWLRYQYPKAFIRRMPLGGVKHSGLPMKANPLAGMPDIFVLKDGKYIGIEVKKPGQKPDPHQEAVHKWLRNAGGTVLVITSLEELQREMMR